MVLHRLGRSLELQGSYCEAIDCFRSSLRKLSNLRNRLQFNDEWKVSFSHAHSSPYRSLSRLLLKQGNVIEALSIAEAARAQALKDLLRFKYNCSETEAGTPSTEEKCEETRLTHFRSNMIFMEVDLQDITFWVIQNGEVTVHKKKNDYYGLSTQGNIVVFLETLIQLACEEIDIRSTECEDRSLDDVREQRLTEATSGEIKPSSLQLRRGALNALYHIVICPIADMLQCKEIVIVPNGPLCLAPFPALLGLE